MLSSTVTPPTGHPNSYVWRGGGLSLSLALSLFASIVPSLIYISPFHPNYSILTIPSQLFYPNYSISTIPSQLFYSYSVPSIPFHPSYIPSQSLHPNYLVPTMPSQLFYSYSVPSIPFHPSYSIPIITSQLIGPNYSVPTMLSNNPINFPIPTTFNPSQLFCLIYFVSTIISLPIGLSICQSRTQRSIMLYCHFKDSDILLSIFLDIWNISQFQLWKTSHPKVPYRLCTVYTVVDQS